MLRRAWLSQCNILSTLRSRSVVYLNNHHRYSTTTEEEENHTTTTTTTTTTTVPTPRYDPHTYTLPFTQSEEASILTTLNAVTQEHIISFGVSKRAASRVLRHRNRLGKFTNLAELLDAEGLGIKSAEDVCKGVLRCGSEGVEGVREKVLVDPKRLVKPRLKDVVLKSIDTFVSLHVTAGFLSWVLCSVDDGILDMKTHTLLTPNARFDAIRIHDKLMSVVQEIPAADFYVWEDRAGYTHLAKAPLGTVIVALQLAQIKGMLMVLLGGGEGEQEEQEQQQENSHVKSTRLLHLKETVIPRLFRLKIGADRLSGLSTADKVMNGCCLGEWLSPVIVESSVREDYFNQSESERRYVGVAVLVCVAFSEVVLRRNVEALRLLS